MKKGLADLELRLTIKADILYEIRNEMVQKQNLGHGEGTTPPASPDGRSCYAHIMAISPRKDVMYACDSIKAIPLNLS